MLQIKHRVVDGIELKRCSSEEHIEELDKWLPLTEFGLSKGTADGLYSHCKVCRRKRQVENRKKKPEQYHKQWRDAREASIDHYREQEQKARLARKERDPEEYKRKEKESTAKRRVLNGDRVREIERNCIKNRTEEQREHIREWRRDWYKTNLVARLNRNIMSLIRKSMKSPALGDKQFADVFKYQLDDFILRLEDTFTEGMSWEKYGFGRDRWSIDHIKPSAAFKFTCYDDLDFLKCWALSNIQAKWNRDNSSKNSFYKGKKYFYTPEKELNWMLNQRRRFEALGMTFPNPK